MGVCLPMSEVKIRFVFITTTLVIMSDGQPAISDPAGVGNCHCLTILCSAGYSFTVSHSVRQQMFDFEVAHGQVTCMFKEALEKRIGVAASPLEKLNIK